MLNSISTLWCIFLLAHSFFVKYNRKLDKVSDLIVVRFMFQNMLVARWRMASVDSRIPIGLLQYVIWISGVGTLDLD